MKASVTIFRDFIALDFCGCDDSPRAFEDFRAHMLRNKFLCWTGVVVESAFMAKVDCRFPSSNEGARDRAWWADRKKVVVGILATWAAERGALVEVWRYTGAIEGIDVSGEAKEISR